MTYIFVIGDSITYGAWDFEKGGWVQRLREFLDQKVKEDNKKIFVTYNLGIDGHSTEDWVRIFEQEIVTRMKIAKKYRESSIIILALGANDVLYVKNKKENNVSIKRFEENMNTLINASRKHTQQVLCVGIPPCRDTETVNYDDGNLIFNNENIMKYNAILWSLTKKQNVLFVDIFKKVQKTKNYISFDGGHLTPEGHKTIFEIVKNVLEEKKLIV